MVIDTSILIDHLRKTTDKKTHFSKAQLESKLYCSSLTVYELYAGAINEKLWAEAKKLLDSVIVIEADEEIAIVAAKLFQQMKGNFIGVTDIYIAATALHLKLPVKTLNIKHFSCVEGLEILPNDL